MALTIREQCSARVLAVIDAVAGVTAVRPRRVFWADDVTGDLTAVVRQGEMRFEHEDADGATGTLVCAQDYTVTLAVIESDEATATYEIEGNRVMAEIIEALAADPDLNGAADYEGVRLVGVTPLDEEIRQSYRLSGETLHLTVTFVTGRTNMETNRR